MQTTFISQILQDLESFNQSSEEELETLKVDGLLSMEGYELVKEIMARSLKPLEPILTETYGETLPESAVLSLVEQYKTKVSRQILKVRSHAYSSKRLLARMRELIRSRLAEISTQIRSERAAFPFLSSVLTQLDQVKTIKAEIDDLQTGLVNRFERELQLHGESQRLFLFEAIAEEFNEKLRQLIDNHLNRAKAEGTLLVPSAEVAATSDTQLTHQLKADLNQLNQRLQSLIRESSQLTQQLQSVLEKSETLTNRLQILLSEDEVEGGHSSKSGITELAN